MTVRDYKDLAEVLKNELNGRYMPAKEARERFSCIDSKLDVLTSAILTHLQLPPGKPNST